MAMAVLQIAPAEVDQWTQVSFAESVSADDYTTSGVLVRVLPYSSDLPPSVRQLTMTACIPRAEGESAHISAGALLICP